MTHFINGKWVEGKGASFTSFSSIDGSSLWAGCEADEGQVNEAVDAANAAFMDWSLKSFDERVAIARKYSEILASKKDELAALISAEAGKVLWDAFGEATAMINKVEISVTAYNERTGEKEAVNGTLRSKLKHRAHGVMAVFGPYNFPGHLPNGHIVPALIAGNTIVFKPSELTPKVAELMVKSWAEAGLPDGVLNMVQGGRSTGVALSNSQGLNGLLFTGSADTGRAIAHQMADRPEVVLALEMGGNNPLIVTNVNDIQSAVYMTVNSAFISSGQRCTCARRLIVPFGKDGDDFISALKETTARIIVHDPASDTEAFMGPVISEAAANNILNAQDKLQSMGGDILIKAERLPQGTAYLSPGLIDVTNITDLPDEEVFGPLLQIIRVKDLDEAIAKANDTRFGLASGLISDSHDDYDYFYPRARAGIVNWNQQLTGAASTAPFGGIGHSGNHSPSAYYAADYCAYGVASIEQADGVVKADAPKGLRG